MDCNNSTLLHSAMDNKNISALKSLISLGIAEVNLNKQDKYLMTPLHIGSINYDRDCFNLLMSLLRVLLVIPSILQIFCLVSPWDNR